LISGLPGPLRGKGSREGGGAASEPCPQPDPEGGQFPVLEVGLFRSPKQDRFWSPFADPESREKWASYAARKVDPAQATTARQFFTALGLAEGEMPKTLVGHPCEWVRRWRDRWGVVVRAVARFSDLDDAAVTERVLGFWQYCKYLLATFPHGLWVNFDETPLWFYQGTGRTNISRRRVRGGQPVRAVGKAALSRRRITVGLTISTDVAFAAALPIFVVLRGERDERPATPAWEDIDIPEGLDVHWQSKAWMTEDLALAYVGWLIQERDRIYGSAHPLMLVWDAFRGHLGETVKTLCQLNNVHMVVVPRGLTALLQGLDTHVNKAFKASCRSWWRRFMCEAEDPRAAALGMQDFLNMIQAAAAEALSLQVVSGPLAGMASGAASFLHNGLTNAVDGSEDALINVRHPAVDPGRRQGLPCALPGPAAALAVADADPGYGSEWSDAEGGSEGDGAGGGNDEMDEADRGPEVMHRIILARGAWVDDLQAAAGASGSAAPRGFVGPPGQRRSTRRIVPALPKQDRCTRRPEAGGGASSSDGAAAGGGASSKAG